MTVTKGKAVFARGFTSEPHAPRRVGIHPGGDRRRS